jgi:hypothetical protein
VVFPKPGVAGSIPAGGATLMLLCQLIFSLILAAWAFGGFGSL